MRRRRWPVGHDGSCSPRPAARPRGAQRGRRRSCVETMRLAALLAAAAKLRAGYRHGTNRPWTTAAQRMNPPGRQRRKVSVEPIQQWTVFRGDVVEVVKGKDAGRQGKVTQVIRARNWVILEGLNTHYRYIGKMGDHRGTYIASEAPLLVTDVALVDPTDRKPTTVDWRFTEEGEKVRVSARSGRIIPKPVFQRKDGIIPEQWKDGRKDTSVEDAMDSSYTPALRTFEEDVMEKMGIVETGRHRRSFWY